MMLWVDGPADVATHMARDASLLEAAERSVGFQPVFRLFTFTPPGITLGASQDPARELDLDRCRADGIGWAVRPTGGRAILHVDEWTYSVTARIADPRFGGTLAAAYDAVSRVIVEALKALGVPASLAAPLRRGQEAAPRMREGSASPCFASAARHEILLDGRKLAGSAQRRTAHALLQQGSILLGPGHERLGRYLRAPEGVRARLERDLATGTSLVRERGGMVSWARWADAVGAALGDDVRRVDGDAGSFLLTPRETAPYARPTRPIAPDAPPRRFA